jgi:hypothetical protein
VRPCVKTNKWLILGFGTKKKGGREGKKDKVLLCFQKERKLYKYFPKVEFLS